MSKKTFEQKIIDIQNKINVPKSHFNSFGGYHFRNCEDILTAVKPHLAEYDLLQTISDKIMVVGEGEQQRVYIKATVEVTDGDKSKVVTGFAREEDSKKGMDDAQVSGSTSSYARKYALNGMWLIDDVKDPDTEELTKERQKKSTKKTKKKSTKKSVKKTDTDDGSSKKKSTKKKSAEKPGPSKKKSIKKDEAPSKKKTTKKSGGSKKKATKTTKKKSTKKKSAKKTTKKEPKNNGSVDVDMDDAVVEELMTSESASEVTQKLLSMRNEADNAPAFMKKYMAIANEIIEQFE